LFLFLFLFLLLILLLPAQCEDESVDLRWQLLQANKEIKKLKKQADAAGLKFPVLSERDEQPPSAKKAAPSVPATPAATPAATPTVRTGRRAGLRSSSKAGLGEPFLELDLKSASKRKAQGDDEVRVAEFHARYPCLHATITAPPGSPK
jgi:hypothetical protein